jgi:hypothetical protein
VAPAISTLYPDKETEDSISNVFPKEADEHKLKNVSHSYEVDLLLWKYQMGEGSSQSLSGTLAAEGGRLHGILKNRANTFKK